METLNELMPVISVLLAVASFIGGRLSASHSKGKNDGVMLTEIGYIKRGVDELTNKMEKSDSKYHELDNRVAVLERSMKLYHGIGNINNGGNM